MLNYKAHLPENGNLESIVILLHGYGANGADLLDLANVWASSFPKTAFLSPDAPTPCEMGGGGFQWFSLSDYTPASMKAGAESVYSELEEFISEVQKKYGVADKKIALCGFSQGTMMSLYAALQIPEKLGGVIGYSGALLDDPKAREEYKDFPVVLIHGESDPVVPVQATVMATHALEKAGFKVEQNLIPLLQHGIDQKGLEIGANFLKKYL